MDERIRQVNESTWIIVDGGVRLFLLAGAERALLIDSGMNLHNARDLAEGLTDRPVSLLNTHADRDHIGSNEQFDRFYMHPAEEALYRRSGKPGTVVPVAEGDRLDLGGRPLEIIHLPGHTPGSIAVLDVNARVLLSGDPIQAHGRVFMFGAHRSLPDYVRSLERLEAYAGRFDEIWPSHADLPVGMDAARGLREGARAILAGQLEGRDEEMFGARITAYDLGFCTLLCDPKAG